MWVNPKFHRVVGAILEAARKKAGVTQVELAKLLKKPQSFISSYESGQRRVDLLELASIAAALGLDPRRLAAKILDEIDLPARPAGLNKRARP